VEAGGVDDDVGARTREVVTAAGVEVEVVAGALDELVGKADDVVGTGLADDELELAGEIWLEGRH
jgi:hypothetical protein